MHDPVNSPLHYTDSSIECIDVIEASMSPQEFKGFLRGNVQKYVWRYDKKRGSEDLKKARWYLDRLITIKEKEETMRRVIEEATKEILDVNYDPDDYMISGCPNGFIPLSSVRQGPSEPIAAPACDH